MPFVEHSYTYHLTRIDHRHNFSVYNTLLHLNSAEGSTAAGIRAESFAFVPQLLLSVVAIPLLLAKKDLPGTMLAQTFAFVTFNKVCTSQVCEVAFDFLSFTLPFLPAFPLSFPFLPPSLPSCTPQKHSSNFSSTSSGTWSSYPSTFPAPRYSSSQG